MQDASFEFPRVILADNKNLILAFASSPALDSGKTVEVIEFDEASSRFGFHKIDFAVTPAKIQRNVQTCTKCHQADPRPNWDGYPLWPGVYGSERSHPAQPSFGALPNEEIARWRKIDFGTERLKRVVIKTGFNAGGESLNTTLSQLNGRRLARKVFEQKNLVPFRFALLAAASCTQDKIETFIPDKVKSQLKFGYAEIKSDTWQHYYRDGKSRCDQFVNLIGRFPNRGHPVGRCERVPPILVAGMITFFEPADFRYIVDGMGGSTADWSIDFGGNYIFSDGGNVFSTFGKAMAEQFPDLKPLLDKYYGGNDLGACAEMKEASLKELGALNLTRLRRSMKH